MSVKLIFEKSEPGAGTALISRSAVPKKELPEEFARIKPPRLPELAESEVGRHYSALARRAFGVNGGFYPLGSCTMKYNPAMGEDAAALPGFSGVHPLQPVSSVQGCLEVLFETGRRLLEVTGMDAMSFAPAAGAHGELTGLMMIKAYHSARGDSKRVKMIVPDSAHGTNPASAAMAGFDVINLPSAPDGGIDLEKLASCVNENTAGLMLTNPNTLGLFENRAAEAAEIIHEAGGLMYYDGANMNAIMGIVRPGDMGFDVLHLNLHKTFATPHGGGGPGSGPVGCKSALTPYLPAEGRAVKRGGAFYAAGGGGSGVCGDNNNIGGNGNNGGGGSGDGGVGRVSLFHGNFLVVVKALTYIIALGAEGLKDASENAVLNANYLKKLLSKRYETAYPGICMHEFVLTLEKLKKATGVTALDVAKSMMDYGMHPPTMYFPLIVHEALMFEPTETETKETLDMAAAILSDIYEKAATDPDAVRNAPINTPAGRPDEVAAARNLRLRYVFEEV